MSEIISKITDPYERQARLYPALLAFVPLAVMFLCLYGPKLTAWSSIGSILVGCGVFYLFSSVARHWSHPDPRVDLLQQGLQAKVARCEKQGLPRREVFASIWRMAHEAAARPAPAPCPMFRATR